MTFSWFCQGAIFVGMGQNRGMSLFLNSTAPDLQPHISAVIPFAVQGCQHLRIAISTSEKGLVALDYIHKQPLQAPQNLVAGQVVQQLERYFDNPRWQFELPLDLFGTPFQQRLWRSLCSVPAGKTDTYGHLARELHSGAQAVGQACRRNPVPVIVPCHRVVSQNGIGGYAGEIDGEKMRIKKALLAHEGYVFG